MKVFWWNCVIFFNYNLFLRMFLFFSAFNTSFFAQFLLKKILFAIFPSAFHFLHFNNLKIIYANILEITLINNMHLIFLSSIGIHFFHLYFFIISRWTFFIFLFLSIFFLRVLLDLRILIFIFFSWVKYFSLQMTSS